MKKIKDMCFVNYQLITLFLIVTFGYIHAKSPRDICKRIPIHTISNATAGSGGFELKILELNGNNKYEAERTYTILINGTRFNKSTKFFHNVYLGFMLVAMPKNATDESVSMGEFQVPRDGRIKEAPGCGHPVITHRYLMMKKGITVKWKAPKANSGCVLLKASVIESSQTWYKDAGNLTIELCEDDRNTKIPQGDGTIQDEDGTGCCACGGARYSLSFRGHWSRQTHPKNFPTRIEDVVRLHWSRLVGASHSEDYSVWNYGELASEGVKELCEFGHSSKLEQEMKRHSKSIMTVVKTTPLWGETQLRRSMHANFNVDRNSHLLSLLSMIGPSPDWCVGITRLNLCQANCTWADQMSVDLYPWDAGTDDGIDYFSINIASNPRRPIRKISHRDPAEPNSPFYGPRKIPPLATLTLTKMKERPCLDDDLEASSGETAVSTNELVARMKKKMMLKKKIEMERCATSVWSEWTGCDSECGPGKRERRRYLKNLQISVDSCGVRLNETKSCQGPCLEGEIRHKLGEAKELPDNYVVRHQELEVDKSLSLPCATTRWSIWSPCPMPCGRGIKERSRQFIRPNEAETCRKIVLSEKDICPACRTPILRNYSAICSQPLNVGPCRGKFPRWYYNTESRECMEFSYGGCRGNDNKFRSQRECEHRCKDIMAGLEAGRTNHVMVDQADNQVTVRRKSKKRRKGNKRNRKQKRRKNARRKAKMARRNRKKDRNVDRQYDGPAVDCVVTEWTAWSPCSVTCGKGVIVKTRTVEVLAQNGGRRCPRKMMRKRKCKMPKCPVNCQLSEWEPWTPCSKTCGENGIQKRRKRIKKKPKRGGRECDTARLEKRMCVLPHCPNAEMSEMMRDAGFYPGGFP